ncbi:MAG: lactonase family protein [Verrucomicrobiae bacterium]|nr:lactonase family protein [Verrucomicrobiae bacterium]
MRIPWKKLSSAFMWIAALSMCVLPAAQSQGAETWRVYIGGYHSDDNFGINYGTYNPANGALKMEGLAVTTDNPSYLALHPKGGFIYCVNETASFDGSGTVSAFSIDSETGKLEEISKLSTQGTYPCHLAVDQKGTRLAVANYGSGSLTVFPINKRNGELSSSTAFFQYSGSSVNKDRQEGPHAHQVAFDPKSRYLYCCDLGTDRIAIYVYNRTGIPLTASSTPFMAAEPGAGPRHMVFHPKEPFCYVLNELNNTVGLYTAAFDSFLWKNIKKNTYHADGKLEKVDSWSLLPPEFDGPSLAAAIRIHPNGKFLYASNRGHDSIAIFSINQETGKLNPLGHVPTGGKNPRDFAIHPDGKTLLVAHQDSNDLISFLVNPQTGELSRSAQEPVKVSKPTCVIFVPVKK